MNWFVKGIIFLFIVVFFVECFEFVVNMILVWEFGEYGMGFYMSILFMIFLIIVIVSLELLILILKFIVELNFKFYESMLRYVFRMMVVFIVFFIVVVSIVFLFILVFDIYYLFIKGIVIGLIFIVVFILIVRGYFMGV